jgi:hypothetical protein
MMATTYQESYRKYRLNPSLKNLIADIQRWENCDTTTNVMRHHVRQFRIFCEQIHAQLLADYGVARKKGDQPDLVGDDWQWEEDQLIFESRVINTLNEQWQILRDAAMQHITGSPYAAALNTLERRMSRLCARLEQALPSRPDGHIFASPPVLYVGEGTRIQFIGTAPAVISVSLGALSDTNPKRGEAPAQLPHSGTGDGTLIALHQDASENDASALSIAHELGHLACESMPHLIDDLKTKLREKWRNDTAQMAALHDVMIGWTEEILADMFGTALEGYDFAVSASKLALAPESLFVLGDSEHPIRAIRPFVHVDLLNYFAKRQVPMNHSRSAVERLEGSLTNFITPLLGRRVSLNDSVTVLTLDIVREQLQRMTQLILSAKPAAFQGRTVGEVLVACVASAAIDEPAGDPELLDWGETSIAEVAGQVLRLPSDEALEPITILLLLAVAVGL